MCVFISYTTITKMYNNTILYFKVMVVIYTGDKENMLKLAKNQISEYLKLTYKNGDNSQ